ncbi:MAG: hypothetical protein AAGH74_07065 [Pseudomonadota bacterium]
MERLERKRVKAWIVGLVALFATVSPSEAAILRYDVTASTVFASNIGTFLPPDQRTPVPGSLSGFFLYDTATEQITNASLLFQDPSAAVQTTFDTIDIGTRFDFLGVSSALGRGPGTPQLDLFFNELLPSGGTSSSTVVSLAGPSFGLFSYSRYSITLSSSPSGVVAVRSVFDIAGTITPTAVPLPPAGLALLAALGGFVALRRRPKIAVCPFKSGS